MRLKGRQEPSASVAAEPALPRGSGRPAGGAPAALEAPTQPQPYRVCNCVCKDQNVSD